MNRLVCAPRPPQIVSCWANFLGGVFPLLSAHYGFNPAVTSAPLMVRSWAAYTCLQQQLLRLCVPLLLAPLRPRLHLRPPVTAAAASADCWSSHLSGSPAVCLPPCHAADDGCGRQRPRHLLLDCKNHHGPLTRGSSALAFRGRPACAPTQRLPPTQLATATSSHLSDIGSQAWHTPGVPPLQPWALAFGPQQRLQHLSCRLLP